MKPLGTITMYYQFIDDSTTLQIDDIMKAADNYCDFVLRLSKRACLDDSPPILAYLASVHAWRLSVTESRRELFQRFHEDPIIRSWTAPQNEVGLNEMMDTINKAITEAEEDWVLIELLCLKSWYARYHTVDEEFCYKPLEKANSLLQSSPNLECFAALYHTVSSETYFMDGTVHGVISFDKANDAHIKGIRLAEKYDDQFQIYQLLWTFSSWEKTWDAKKALELQEEAYRLARSFGAPQKIAEAMADMGRISEALGEYDLAIECYQNSLDTYGSPEMELYREVMDSPTVGLSRIFCELGNGESGIDWIETAFDIVNPLPEELPYLFAQRAEALILLNRLQEAALDLESCQRGALKSGGEGYMALCELGASYLEKAQGHPETAIRTLEPGYEFLSPRPAAIYINRFLIALTRAEIAVNLDGKTEEVSEKWMSLLEKHAKERDLPGIIMMHALLKAEYLLARGLKYEAIETLKEAVLEDHSDTASTLFQRITTRLEALQVP